MEGSCTQIGLFKNLRKSNLKCIFFGHLQYYLFFEFRLIYVSIRCRVSRSYRRLLIRRIFFFNLGPSVMMHSVPSTFSSRGWAASCQRWGGKAVLTSQIPRCWNGLTFRTPMFSCYFIKPTCKTINLLKTTPFHSAVKCT